MNPPPAPPFVLLPINEMSVERASFLGPLQNTKVIPLRYFGFRKTAKCSIFKQGEVENLIEGKISKLSKSTHEIILFSSMLRN